MRKVTLLLALCLFSMIGFSQSAKFRQVEVANQFFKAYEEMDFDKMASYWDDSVVLKDYVVAELYKIPEQFKGRETVLKLWKQAFAKLPNYMKIDIHNQFESGPYVVTNLSLESSSSQGDKTGITRGEMFTIFKFEGDKIVEHLDFGDYYTWGRQIESVFKGNHHVEYPEEANIQIARDYMEAYSRLDVAKMKSFYADSVEFKDLTAKEAFKGNVFEFYGKDAVANFWQKNLADAKPGFTQVLVEGAFFSGSFVMLNTRFSMVLPPSWTGGVQHVYVNIPIKTILQIKDGKIYRHYDFADYSLYQQQIALQTKR